MFAIITFRKSGPIKTWSAMRAANVHNARTKPLAHAVAGAPGPRHLVGGRDLVSDVKGRLRLAKLDPHRLRRNGVIAYEAILTASAEFFDRGTPAERRDRLEAWTMAQVAWADERYGPLRIASMVLHEDEKTPHVHLVVLPLEVKSDARRTDRAVRWGLVGRTISGPGRFDEVQDAYAAAMAPFGLVRGVAGSARKHEPVPIYLARLAAKEQDIDRARAAVDVDAAEILQRGAALSAAVLDLGNARRAFAAEVARREHEEELRRRAIDADRDRMLALVAAEQAQIAAEKARLEEERSAHAAQVAIAEQRIATEREVLRRQALAFEEQDRQLRAAMAAQRERAAETGRALEAAIMVQDEAEQDRAAAAADRARARSVADKIEEHRVRLLPTLRAAADFRRKVAAVAGHGLTPAASSTRAAVSALHDAAAAVAPPAGECRPNVIAAYARIRDGAGRLGP